MVFDDGTTLCRTVSFAMDDAHATGTPAPLATDEGRHRRPRLIAGVTMEIEVRLHTILPPFQALQQTPLHPWTGMDDICITDEHVAFGGIMEAGGERWFGPGAFLDAGA